ncbi:MAG: helix-turn-helix domain-containing protein [Firmicutes bacterium]|nr:helix-turn-helix domain-containing protein [Bacillota bacterium]
MGFSEQLKKARLKTGYTQQEVAELMGITKSTYCGYEIGKRQPDVAKIKQLSNILNVSGDILLETGIHDLSNGENNRFKNDLDISEQNHIKKYRLLDNYGKEAVDSILEIEYQRVQSNNTVPHSKVIDNYGEETVASVKIAAYEGDGVHTIKLTKEQADALRKEFNRLGI